MSQLSSLPPQFEYPSSLLADDTSAFVNDVARVYATDADPVTFEPVVDVPALLATMLVLVGALLLRLRQSAIANAADTREAALDNLRTIKTKELSQAASPEQVQRAVQTYQAALDEEERLRTLLPGIRLRAPNNPQKSEQDQQAVRQFLGPNATTFVNESNEQDAPKIVLPDEDAPFNIGPVLGLGALLFLILSPQFLTMFINESDTVEILDMLSSGSPS